MDIKRFNQIFDKIADNVNTVIHGKDDVVRLSMVAICAGGHILFEDVPGVGKSMLAVALGRSMQAETSRVQCTPDMLPSIFGVPWREISANGCSVTGAAPVLETSSLMVNRYLSSIAMVRRKVRPSPLSHFSTAGVEGVRLPLPSCCQSVWESGSFAVTPVARTQPNFRFHLVAALLVLAAGLALRVSAAELALLALTIGLVLTAEALNTAVESYILDITHATRADNALTLGAGPRATIALGKASRVMAASDGRDTVYPEDVKALLRPVLAHRMMMTPDAVLRGETVDDVIERVLSRVKPPLGVQASASVAANGNGNGNGNGKPATARTRRSRAKAGVTE